MNITALQYAKTLFESLQDTATKDHEQVLDNFAQTLALNNDLAMFDEISDEFEKLEKAAKGIKIAEVTSARPLDKGTEKELVDHLNKMVNGQVELRKKIDEKILGGVVIKLEDNLIDASIKTSLEDLKTNLND
jgi:F-type H+-transporting ATPase subunit delta